MPENKNKNSAFTLIELLIVIAIIGLLASIVLAAVGRARSKAQVLTVEENMHQVAKALDLYYADNGFYPAGGYSTVGGFGGPASWPTFQALLTSYTQVPNFTDPAILPAGGGIQYNTSSGFIEAQYSPDPNTYCVTWTVGQGYLLMASMTNSDSTTQNDGGIIPSYFEIYGGNYKKGQWLNGTCVYS